MAKSSVADMSESELLSALADAKEEHFNLRFQHATGQLENHARLGEVKKQVARLMGQLRSLEIAAAEALSEES